MLSSLITTTFFVLCFTVIDCLLIKEYKISSVHSTNLSLLISAFISLEEEKDEK
jgi:hypothetical protein